MEYQSVNLFVQDESRFGMFTKNGSMLTAKGIKPICSYQQIFKSTYLFGAFSPITGDKLLLELPACNSEMFQLFLDELTLQKPEEFKIVLLDNGAFHKAKILNIPKNIYLLFLPPYSPELNPAEKIWANFKRTFTNRLFSSLEEISNFIEQETKNLTTELVQSICSFDYIFSDLNWTI